MATDFTRSSLRLAAAVLVAGGLAACSTMEDLDPTGILGSDSSASDASGIPPDGTQTTADNTTAGIPQPGEAAQPDETTAQPDVASIPDRPQPPSSAADNAQTASSLQADAANVQYSAESLRGGTEASAPPPDAQQQAAAPTQVAEAAPPPAQTPSAAAPETSDVPASNVTPGTMGAEATPAQPAAAPPPSDSPLTEAPAQPAPAAPPSDTPDSTSVPEAAPETASADTAAAPAEPQATATAEAPAQPAAAASPEVAPAPTQVASAAPVPGAQAPVTRRAAVGFAPSSAPPLDPSVSQFVAAPVVARYKQTAMLKPSVFPDYSSAPSGYGPATATVMFPGDTTILDDKALQQVRAAAELYKAHGGGGYVRIVGYASVSSGNLTASRLMHVNFDHSQARATAIARALMKEGVPASKVLVDTAPQSAAVAKAEIFVQG